MAAPAPGTYPVAVSVQLTRDVEVVSRFVPADRATRRPAHVEVRVDQLVWQVCDPVSYTHLTLPTTERV